MSIITNLLAWLLGKLSKTVIKSKIQALEVLCKETLESLSDDVLSEEEAAKFLKDIVAIFKS